MQKSALFALALMSGHLAYGQATTFIYQGQLNANGTSANVKYDLTFAVYDSTTSPGNIIAGPLTNNPTPVTNGLFVVSLDFGAGVFNGNARWLQIGVRTNGNSSAYTILAPRQPFLPVPYAIFATSASNLLGSVSATQLTDAIGNAQLANSSITINAGTGLNGGGTVPLGSSTILNNVGVTSLTGDSDITVSAATGAVTLGTTASSTNVPNTIVRRDSSGNFYAGSITVGGSLNLPSVPVTVLSGAAPILIADGLQNFFAGPGAGNLTLTGNDNTAYGVSALASNTTGYYNTATGIGALGQTTIGHVNTADGAYALYHNLGGDNNVAVGAYALFSSSNGLDNTAIGFGALYSNTGDVNGGHQNTACGYEALYNSTETYNNTAVGYKALFLNTEGLFNTASGSEALYNNTTGIRNVANGVNALASNTTGSENTALGYLAGAQITLGGGNIVVGSQAGYNLIRGSNNIAIDNQGFTNDDSTIRIGTQGTQTQTFLAGVYGATVVTGVPVYVNTNG
jgi:hypothetical protein